jgi:intein-encoded DNA endonuclease-like protein
MPRKINAVAALAEIKRRRKIAGRGSRYSKLNRYRSSLVSLRLAGASYRDMVFWLRTSHRINTNHTTLMRWMKSLPEITEKSRSDMELKSNE